MFQQGQNLRFATIVDSVKKYIAGAMSFDLSIDADINDASTKDVTSGWKQNQAGLKGWSGSGQCRLTLDAQDIAAIKGWDLSDMVGNELDVTFDETDGEMNRETVRTRKYGKCILTSWKISAPNQDNATVDFSFTGNGPLNNAPIIVGAHQLTATTTNQTSNYFAKDGSVISSQVEASATWLTANIANGVLTYKASANTGAERSAKVTLSTPNGGELIVTITQEAAA